MEHNFSLAAFYISVGIAIAGWAIAPWGTFKGYWKIKRDPTAPSIPKTLFSGLLCTFGANIIQFAIMEWMGTPSPAELDTSAPTLKLTQEILFSVTLIPVFEELIDRGYFLEAFRKANKLNWGIGLSCIFFAAAHPNTWVNGFFVGLLLMYLRLATNGLAAGVLFHGCVNLVASALALIPDDGGTSDMTEIGIAAGIGVLLFAAGVPGVLRAIRYMFAPKDSSV